MAFFALIANGKSTYRNLLGLQTARPLYTRKSVNLRLPDIEALRKPSRMISDVHAIARTTTITVILLGLRNFSGFYIILITAIVVIV